MPMPAEVAASSPDDCAKTGVARSARAKPDRAGRTQAVGRKQPPVAATRACCRGGRASEWHAAVQRHAVPVRHAAPAQQAAPAQLGAPAQQAAHAQDAAPEQSEPAAAAPEACAAREFTMRLPTRMREFVVRTQGG
jgi:hypothetical protein